MEKQFQSKMPPAIYTKPFKNKKIHRRHREKCSAQHPRPLGSLVNNSRSINNLANLVVSRANSRDILFFFSSNTFPFQPLFPVPVLTTSDYEYVRAMSGVSIP